MDAAVERRLVHASGGLVPLAFVLDLAIVDRLTRGYEQVHLAGYALYALSATATLWVFSPDAAVPGALV